MSTAEVKNYLHRMIVEIEDVALLEQALNYLNLLRTKEHDWWNDLTDGQKTSINKTLKEIENGETFSHEEVKGRINQLIQSKK